MGSQKDEQRYFEVWGGGFKMTFKFLKNVLRIFWFSGDVFTEWNEDKGFIPVLHWSAQSAIGRFNKHFRFLIF